MKHTLQKLNKQIDDLILKGKTGTKQYRDLCRLHKITLHEIQIYEATH